MVVVVVIIYLFAACSFTAATLSHFTGLDATPLQTLMLCIPTLYVTALFASLRWRNVALEFVSIASSVAMGFLNFASLAAVLCWVTWWGSNAFGISLDRTLLASTLYGCSIPVGAYGLLNAHSLRVTAYDIPLRNLPSAWDGKTVAVVSDVHVGNIFGPRFVRKIVQRLNALQPTTVFICGDVFDGAVVDIPEVVKPWAGLSAPRGAYFVTGNHEEIGDRAPYLAELSKAGVTVLNNTKVMVEGLQIVGVHDAEAHRRTVFQQILEQLEIDQDRPSILLAHRPGRLDVPEKAGISLQLSGHTHAGQFPPFSLVVRMIYGRFGYGHHRHGALQVVTSSGAGTGGPPFRVGTRSEIVVLRLRAERAA
jgi:predicted MPP superfamily phosphohydrolase